MKGHLRERGKGNWWAVVDLGDDPETGKRRQKWLKLASTSKKKAQDELNNLLADIGKGAYVAPSTLTVGEFLERWITSVKPNLAAKTHERYEQVVRLHLIPNLGDIPLGKLGPLQVQQYYAHALASGRMDRRAGNLSPQTVVHHSRILHEAMQTAVKWQLIPRNPCDGAEPPRVVRAEMHILTPEQVGRLLETARESSVYVAIVLAIATGARRGEILALRWTDVDLDAATIAINRALEKTKAGIAYKEPKTARSRRVVSLPAFAVEALRRHRVEQAEQRLRMGPVYEDEGLVCAAATGGPLVNNLSRDYQLVLAKAGLPRVNFHSLRHAHASMLLSQGVHAKTISDRLGHSGIAITMDLYSHLLPGVGREAATKLDNLLGSAVRAAAAEKC